MFIACDWERICERLVCAVSNAACWGAACRGSDTCERSRAAKRSRQRRCLVALQRHRRQHYDEALESAAPLSSCQHMSGALFPVSTTSDWTNEGVTQASFHELVQRVICNQSYFTVDLWRLNLPFHMISPVLGVRDIRSHT